jgi:hypothetical protein
MMQKAARNRKARPYRRGKQSTDDQGRELIDARAGSETYESAWRAPW